MSEVSPDIIFVAADEPLLIFGSIADAESCLTAADVDDGVYTAAYGPTGIPFSIRTEAGKVIVRQTDEPARPEELRALLINYLTSEREEASDQEPLDVLAERAVLTKDFWDLEDPYGDRHAHETPWWGCLIVVAIVLGAIVLIRAILR